MYAVKSGSALVKYWKMDGGGWVASKQPADVANELIRRSDSYRTDDWFLFIDGGIRYDLNDMERVA